VYINNDGSVTGTDKIQRNGNVYTLTGDILGGITILADSIVIDGASFKLQGEGIGPGINVSGNQVTIKNLQITHFQAGISTGINIVSNCNISGNTIANNSDGIVLGSESKSHAISGNFITGNTNGIVLSFTSNNTLVGNTITNNEIGIWVVPPIYSYGLNKIYLNNFINNSKQVIQFIGSASPIFNNIWDNGGEGNYWDNYNASDSNGDGIGDAPYVIDSNNVDNYPLMTPFNLIPELPSFLVVPLFVVLAMLAVLIHKMRTKFSRGI
jgi:parallel beta-helix repeat protein